MSWRVSVRAAADADLAIVKDWYDLKKAGLGTEFLLAIAETFLRLEESPASYPTYYRDFRRAMTARFPYKVFFRIEGDVVIVFRILHAAQDHTIELPNR
jgi:plasmid stabilization system protein ParE